MDSETAARLIRPRTDEDFFAIGRILLGRSTCLKMQTASLIVQDGNIISYGYNMCCPQDQLYGLPVTSCPRMDTQTGTAYELCKPIHAEIVAVINAFGIGHADRKSLWHFPGFTLKLASYRDFFKGRAILYLLGHYWACDECIAFLKYVGITEIKFDDLSGGKTLQDYRQKNLTGKETGLNVAGCLLNGIVSVEMSPDHFREFCDTHGIGMETISRVPEGAGNSQDGFYIVPVPPGEEQSRCEKFAKDPRVTAVKRLAQYP